MKKVLYFLSLLFLVSLSSCKKDDDNSSKDAIPMEDKQEIASNLFSYSMDYSSDYSLKKSTIDTASMTIQNPEGGSVEIKISMTLNEQSMSIVITENFKDFVITTSSGRKYTLSTPDKPIVVNMNYNSSSTMALTMTLKGTVQVSGYATGSISYDLTYTINQSGTEATMTGTINGEKVNIKVNVNDY